MPTADASAYTFGLVLQSRRATISDLASAIKHIEPISASLCATRPDRVREVVPVLRANLKQGARVLRFDDRNIDEPDAEPLGGSGLRLRRGRGHRGRSHDPGHDRKHHRAD